MRIIDVCAFYTPHGGGVRTYVESKLRAAAAAGHEMIVLAPGARTEVLETGQGGVLATIASPPFPLDRRYRYFADEAGLHAELNRWRPDVVEVSSPWGSASMVARWGGAAKRSLVMHADPLAAYAYRWFEPFASVERIDRGFDWFWRHLKRLDGSYDVVVSASASLSKRLLAGGLRNVTTIPMGVVPAVFSPRLRDEALRATMLERCCLPQDATLLVGVGRHSPEKRWDMVLDAVTAAGAEVPVGLVLLGEGRGTARLLRAAHGSPHALIAGAVRDRGAFAAILASADALVHGCEAETFCLVASEAVASGVPLVVPDRGGAHDQLAPGCGTAYRAADARALRETLTARRTGDWADWRARAGERADRVRTMRSHFDDLFGCYCRLSAPSQLAA